MTFKNSMKRVMDESTRLVLPSLVPIYERPEGDASTRQIGTGFLVEAGERTFMLTAHHTLYGHNGDEDPSEKCIVARRKLRRLSDGQGRITFGIKEADVAGLCVRDLHDRTPLPFKSLYASMPSPTLVIQGFLARDFKRSISSSVLKPTALIHVDRRIPASGHEIGISYQPNRISSMPTFEQKKRAPIPRGLSGCPMVDALRLLDGWVSVVGLFTEYRNNGKAFGTNSMVLRRLMNDMIEADQIFLPYLD